MTNKQQLAKILENVINQQNHFMSNNIDSIKSQKKKNPVSVS